MTANLLRDCLENALSLWSEAAKNKDRFGRNSIENVPKPFTIEQMINELSNLNVVDGHRRLIFHRDHQISLTGVCINNKTPDNSRQTRRILCYGRSRLRKHPFDKHRASKGCTLENSSTQVRPIELHPLQVCLSEIGVMQLLSLRLESIRSAPRKLRSDKFILISADHRRSMPLSSLLNRR
jgi:hypothetical protein